MKKVLILGVVALFSAGAFVVTSCDDDNPISCTQKLADVIDASSAYSVDKSTTNCEAYKDALQDYINCDGINAVDKTAYQTTLEALPCY
ncbi:MAG: hypothetical protein C0597_11190 [Marinilabiliales bacterium]|nr:MAG: hypothetical protein C0597_11190 [Marinilabiliales bacterium]